MVGSLRAGTGHRNAGQVNYFYVTHYPLTARLQINVRVSFSDTLEGKPRPEPQFCPEEQAFPFSFAHKSKDYF